MTNQNDPFGNIQDFHEKSQLEVGDAYRERPSDRPPFNKKWFDVYWAAREDGADIQDATRCAKEYS